MNTVNTMNTNEEKIEQTTAEEVTQEAATEMFTEEGLNEIESEPLTEAPVTQENKDEAPGVESEVVSQYESTFEELPLEDALELLCANFFNKLTEIEKMYLRKLTIFEADVEVEDGRKFRIEFKDHNHVVSNNTSTIKKENPMTEKQATKKVAKKATKKVTKKPAAKKAVKKVAKKPAKKAAKKATKKASKK